MIYNIKIGDRSFEVAIDDINKRPVLAHVNGQEFLVTPELGAMPVETEPQPISLKQPVLAGSSDLHESVMVAPLPGTIIDVFVKPGDKIETGQVVVIIEAMKMKNSIRSTTDGIVAAVLVSAGQTVAHKQALLEFQE